MEYPEPKAGLLAISFRLYASEAKWAFFHKQTLLLVRGYLKEEQRKNFETRKRPCADEYWVASPQERYKRFRCGRGALSGRNKHFPLETEMLNSLIIHVPNMVQLQLRGTSTILGGGNS